MPVAWFQGRIRPRVQAIVDELLERMEDVEARCASLLEEQAAAKPKAEGGPTLEELATTVGRQSGCALRTLTPLAFFRHADGRCLLVRDGGCDWRSRLEAHAEAGGARLAPLQGGRHSERRVPAARPSARGGCGPADAADDLAERDGEPAAASGGGAALERRPIVRSHRWLFKTRCRLLDTRCVRRSLAGLQPRVVRNGSPVPAPRGTVSNVSARASVSNLSGASAADLLFAALVRAHDAVVVVFLAHR